ncbi:MAG: TonB-dependent receptor domain-containing protein [Fidelibacterota bacterium]
MKKLLLLIFMLFQVLVAQTGRITGSVTDEISGEPLQGVNILVKNTFFGTATDVQGEFDLAGLAPGTYDLMISMIGYRKMTWKDITVRVGEISEVTVTLQQDVLSAPQVIVTATRKEQDIMDAPLSVTIISPRIIQEKGAIDLNEVLPYEAGINTVKGQLNIRGASGYSLGTGDRSLLLLDGVPLLGSAAGNITWSIIPTSEVERVEIVKSGGSALYGSSALGGVVNILTRNAPAVPETRFFVKSGFYSDPKYKQWRWRNQPGKFNVVELTHSRPLGPHSAWLRIQAKQDDSYSRLEWNQAANLTGKIKFNFGQRYTASLYGNYYADKGGLSSQWKNAAHPFQAPRGDEKDYAKGTKLNLNGFFNILYSDQTYIKFRTSIYDVWWQNYGRTNQDYSNERKWFEEVQVTSNLGKNIQTTSGIVFQQAGIDAKIFGNHSSLSTAAYFLAQARPLKKLTLTAGGRYERYSVDTKLLDQTLAPQIAFNWRQAEWLSFRGSVSRGFRVPTVAEMFTHSRLNVFQVEPNPDLVAETSTSYELGSTVMSPGNWWVSNLKIDGALFSSTFDQLVEPTPDETGIIHFENITNARISGAELGTQAGLLGNRFLLNLAYTWLNPVEIDRQGKVIDTLSYRFRHSLVTTTATRLRGLTATVEYRYSSRIEKVELFDENTLTGQDRRVPIHLWNGSLAYSIRGWELLFRVENLFQYYYTELERNMGKERNFAITVTKKF